MRKREKHRLELNQYQITDQTLASYLLRNSNLPGRSANLELAFAFGDYIADQCNDSASECLEYCLKLIAQYPEHKNEIGNEEFLPFCAIVGLGHIGGVEPVKRKSVLELLRIYAKDSRWRIREAVAMAIQTIMENDPDETIGYLLNWMSDDDYLVHRALVAGLANPGLLENPDFARQALAIHKSIIGKIGRESSVRDNNLKILVKGLSYTLSVVVSGIEEQGFAYLEELIQSESRVIQRIARENLKKNRLQRLNPKKTQELLELTKQT